MNRATKNRGPDDEGAYSGPQATLGHVRLSIIDLSEKGRQPMSNEDDTIWIVYNGEIYNYKEIRKELDEKGHTFQSCTDTEVVLHAYEEYGMECLKHFNGMWAFCIYDIKQNSLILCRDRFGIKPLYYYISGGKIIFSSMIAGILCHAPDTSPNDKAIMQFLAYNLEDHSADTFFNNISRLEPGCLLKYSLDTGLYKTIKWYSISQRKGSDEKDIRDAFIESIRLRTVADVPVGSCLSGGIDSTSIVCTLSKYLDYPFDTFSYVSPGSPTDETRYMKEVGRHANINQYFTQITENNFLDDLDDFLEAQEEPVTGLSVYAQYRVMKLAHEKGAKVLLDGQGGDEIFAGYIYYFSYYFYELLCRRNLFRLFSEMFQYVCNFKNLFPVKMFHFMLLPEFIKKMVWGRIINSWINHDMLNSSGVGITDPRWNKMTLNEALRMTLSSTAIPHLLRWEDKNAMRWGIENRVPFLDVNLVEKALSLPGKARIANGKTKIIFKNAVKNIIPELIRSRKDKIGFTVPVDDFIRKTKVAEYCRQIIFSDSFRKRPYWKWTKVEKMFSSHIKGKKNFGNEIWKWINLELWLRKYF